MSNYLIKEYYDELERIIQYGGSRNEGAVSSAFQRLLKEYCKTKGLVLIPQLELRTKDDKIIKPDGTVKDALRLDWGYWESKDKYDDLEKEIEYKISKGYPTNNILYEDSQKAILIQHGTRCKEADMTNAEDLDELLTMFANYERPEVKDFREAIEKFKEDIPTVVDTLRGMIEDEENTNQKFKKSAEIFLEICHESINPNMVMADIREMMIQHILTEEIFLTVFNESQFHRENNIAKELDKVIDTFFTGRTKRETLEKVDNYYKVIKRTATDIYNHQEKQKFLKIIYENFYKAYNIKAADRLGIIYTPNEVVRFMIESADYLLHTHFGKFMYDKNVEIMDPFTGTGTFVTEIIDFLPKSTLEYKYKNEIHCNEVAILPYYIANLNIEYTYKQKMDKYEEFTNICFVDTLDNVAFEHKDKQEGFDFGLGVENAERIKNQNKRKISVVISNPPYNANQLNENENNKNREYPEIDRRIKDTYIHYSKAQKTKMYDMYTRSLRWASDRLNKNGIIAFISNRSFIDGKHADGFRQAVTKEFNEIYIIDLKGDARTSGERRRREGGNIFHNSIRVGVAIYFLIKKEDVEGCNIYYNAIKDYANADEKLEYVTNNKFPDINFAHITPDKDNNWLNITDNDYSDLVPLINEETKYAKRQIEECAIFKLYSLGLNTARDEWVYDFDEKKLKEKVSFLIDYYNGMIDQYKNTDVNDTHIKWTHNLKQGLLAKEKYEFKKNNIYDCLARVFIKKKVYFANELNERPSQMPKIFPNPKSENIIISLDKSSKPFSTLAAKYLIDYHFNGDAQCIPLYVYNDRQKHINVTDWGIKLFREHYKNKTISGEDIFHYAYAVLNNPSFVKKYEINLKRENPRISLYEDFDQWSKWGKKLLNLHINYEEAKSYPLKCVEDKEVKNTEKGELLKKAKLKADYDNGTIEIDGFTTLKGIPKEAWEYKLGNRSAIEWILDQYKEKTPKDPTIRTEFNTYRFADYKEEVIELIKKITTVSVETMKIIKAMPEKE